MPCPPGEHGSALEAEIDRRCTAARLRLQSRARGVADTVTHYRKPAERSFTEAERDQVTILFGGLTARHDRLVQSVFESCGYSCRPLPQPDLVSCQIGKQYCNNGVCNPAYFTIGTL